VSRVGFSLIELIIVVFLIGVFSFIAIKLPSSLEQKSFDNLRDILYPNGEIYIFDDKSVLLIKDNKEKFINFNFSPFEVYDIDGNLISFNNYKNKKVIFHYKIKNGIGDVLIVKEKKVYYFKPLYVKVYKNLQSLKNNLVLVINEGEYY
jgi:prepilin-type N-terminal cleavage/methylation domain-containing protein